MVWLILGFLVVAILAWNYCSNDLVKSLVSLFGFERASHPQKVQKGEKEQVYADYAGCPPVDTGFLSACFQELLNHSQQYRNPHSIEPNVGGRSIHMMNELREKTLQYCRAGDDEYVCIITHGATSACALVAESFPWDGDFWYLMDNHTSVVGMKGCAEAKNANTRAVSIEEVLRVVGENESLQDSGMGLFAMPLESNFSGIRYSMNLVHSIQYDERGEQRMRVLLDAAKACASCPPDLSGPVKPDFVVLSYYKIFGYPTGLGALIVRRDALSEMSRSYVGGGTVDFFVATENVCDRKKGEGAFEDGTPSYFSIPCAVIGFDWFQRNVGTPSQIDACSVSIAKRLADKLLGLRHGNGRPICRVYGAWGDIVSASVEECRERQGSIVSFNIFDQFGDAYGCREVQRMASVRGIALRSGALCNSGGLIEALKIPSSEMVRWRRLGYTCDGRVDSIDGVTTGVVRASFGYQSVPEDADRIASFIETYFTDVSLRDPSLESTSSGLVSRVHVDAMYIYPIKSCQPQRVHAWALENDGLRYDRFWKIIDANGSTVSLKKCPLLCKIYPVVSIEEETLTIFFENQEEDCVTVSLEQVRAVEYSRMNAWLSSKLGFSCTLVDQRSNESDKNYSNQGDCLVLFKSSVTYLHSISTSSEDLETFTKRMRPNIVLSDSYDDGEQAFEDEKWEAISARDEDVIGTRTRHCTRCHVICIDPHTGKQSENMEPLRSIMTTRKSHSRNEKISFGSLFSFQGCYIQTGMEFDTVY